MAAAVVVALGSLALARRAGPPDLRITAKVSGTPTPTAERPDAPSAPAARTHFLGSGPWTMSSLPSCFVEQYHQFGRLDELRAKFPPDSQRVAPGTVVRAANCTIAVRAHELWISRDSDRLRVPREARLYRAGDRLTLIFIEGGRAEIRHYCPSFDALRCPAQSFPSRHRRIAI